jgi:hypothetical protein
VATAAPGTRAAPPRLGWLAPGDVNAFFGLAIDNLTNLVVLTGLLVGVFGFPADLVLLRMVPGTALGVLVGDLAYTWLAVRLARRTGRADVTAMPFGIDTPSLFGMVVKGLAEKPVSADYAEWTVGLRVSGALPSHTPILSDRCRSDCQPCRGESALTVIYVIHAGGLVAP